MSLLPKAVPGSTVTQRFGIAVPAVAKSEPAMWYKGTRAYWVKFAGSVFCAHFHPGIDESAPIGTPVVARESGIVVLAGYHNKVSGIVVRVEIRPGVSRYGANHLSKVLVSIGQHVTKGQTIALVGAGGQATTGPSTHAYVEVYEPGLGWVCYDPAVFIPGGALQNDPRIQPTVPVPAKIVRVKGAGINIRNSPDLDQGTINIFGTSRADGIYSRAGVRVGPLNYGFVYLGDVASIGGDDGIWVKVTGFGKTLYISKPLVNIT